MTCQTGCEELSGHVWNGVTPHLIGLVRAVSHLCMVAEPSNFLVLEKHKNQIAHWFSANKKPTNSSLSEQKMKPILSKLGGLILFVLGGGTQCYFAPLALSFSIWNTEFEGIIAVWISSLWWKTHISYDCLWKGRVNSKRASTRLWLSLKRLWNSPRESHTGLCLTDRTCPKFPHPDPFEQKQAWPLKVPPHIPQGSNNLGTQKNTLRCSFVLVPELFKQIGCCFFMLHLIDVNAQNRARLNRRRRKKRNI